MCRVSLHRGEGQGREEVTVSLPSTTCKQRTRAMKKAECVVGKKPLL